MHPKILATLLGSLTIAMSTAYGGPPGDEGVAVDTTIPGQDAKETPAERNARMGWWREAKFGLFIHWGVYAVPGGKYGDKTGYGEWLMHSAKIPVAEYRQFAAQFNPVNYDPAQWAKLAKDAGMKYIVITAKHHDGFALYPSAASAWNVADATLYKKDLLGPLVESAKAEGLKIGFYYSQAQDWNNPGGAKKGFGDGGGWDEAQKGSFDAYLKTVATPQVRELLTRYPIDILWWDTPQDMTVQRAAPIAALVKKLRPGLIMNNRLGGGFKGDTSTPEQYVPATGYPGDWETCMTMNGHWGYNAFDHNWKSSTELIRKLADIVAKGGNFLLNVGPTPSGEIPRESVERLRDVGKWLRVNGDAIYGTVAGPFNYLSWGAATRKVDKLYLHVFNWPTGGKLFVPLNNAPQSAVLLADGKKLTAKSENGRIVIDVPVKAPDAADSVIVLTIEGEPITKRPVTAEAIVTASGAKPGYEPENIIDGTGERRWSAPDNVKSGWLEVELKEATTVSAFAIDEPDVWPRLKQTYVLEAMVDGVWTSLASGISDGHGLKHSIATVTARKFRVTLSTETGVPGVAELQLYRPE